MSGQDHFPVIRVSGPRVRRFFNLISLALGFVLTALGAGLETDWPPAPERLAMAKEAFARRPTDAAAAVRVVQACFEASWGATNTAPRAKFAEEGIAVAREALKRHSAEAGLEYYLALNLGQLASTRGMSALKLVREMETHLLAARKLDATLSEAGPDRSLGYLYLDAPGWPVSVGSHEKARKHLENALKLAPVYPEHALALAEACLRWKKPEEAARHVAMAEALWPEAKERFAGPRWQSDWTDWEKRLARLKSKLKAQ